LQLVPMHVYGAQSMVAPLGAVSVCMPSHDAASFETHALVFVLHVNIGSQSASLLHDVPHASPAHTYGAHVDVTSFPHAPVPVHVAAAVATPFVHEAVRQAVAPPTKPRHALRETPSHVAFAQTSSIDPAGHCPWPAAGAPMTPTHEPFASDVAHDSHRPVHDELQHTPSAQKAPGGQADASVHGAPYASSCLHVPEAQ
jgi:hypothetical protein